MGVFRLTVFLLLLSPFISRGEIKPGVAQPEVAQNAQTLQENATAFSERSPDTTKKMQELAKMGPSCDTKRVAADNVCLESLNPEIKSFSDEYGMILQLGASSAGNLMDQCSSISQVLDKASKLLTLYQASCGTVQGVCHSGCTKVPSLAKEVVSGAGQTLQSAMAERDAACAQQSPTCVKLQAEVAKLNKAYMASVPAANLISSASQEDISRCAGYTKTRDSALAGAATALMGLAKSDQCKKDFSNQAAANLDCTTQNSPNYSTVNCQCARNELPAAQCQGINANPQAALGSGQVQAAGFGSNAGGTSDGLGADLGDSSFAKTFEGASSSSAPGAPVDGGGGGVGGGGGGSGAYALDGAGGPRSRLNPNVLGGYGGGGGGGGFGSGPGYSDTDPSLKPYSPGGEKDPKRSLASELAKQVTPEAGRSNWEKVKTRYRDNYRTLLNK